MPVRKILILEDEWLIADDCAAEIISHGMRVIGPYGTIWEGLKALRTLAPDGALLDVKLRDGLVYGLADLLRCRGIPIVFYAGYGRADLPARFTALPYFEKPHSPAEVARALISRTPQMHSARALRISAAAAKQISSDQTRVA